MKKIICILTVVAILVTLTACKEQEDTIVYEPVVTTEKTTTTTRTVEIYDGETITVDNNVEFKQIMESTERRGAKVEDFAKKYDGRTIKFDGNISFMRQTNSSYTKFGIAIDAGDFNAGELRGPHFYLDNVTMEEMNLSEDDKNSGISSGDNITVTAIIDYYSVESKSIYLKILKLEKR